MKEIISYLIFWTKLFIVISSTLFLELMNSMRGGKNISNSSNLCKHKDPDIINRITEENGSCTPQEFLRAYTEQDPKFKKTLEKKYDITTQEDDFYDYR